MRDELHPKKRVKISFYAGNSSLLFFKWLPGAFVLFGLYLWRCTRHKYCMPINKINNWLINIHLSSALFYYTLMPLH